MAVLAGDRGVYSVAKNDSTSFYGTIVALAESPLVEDLIYAGTDDGLVQVTEDGGAHWRKVEKPAGVPEDAYVQRITASQHDAGDSSVALEVLNALGPVRAGVVSNADREHLAAWGFTLPVEFVLISETLGAYKPHPRVFQSALNQLGLQPHDVLYVGDSEVDDVKGAKAAGLRVVWLNRDGRSRRPDVPPPDFEIRHLAGVLMLL